MMAGCALMVLVGLNYAYLMKAYPDTGGAYVYAREQLGHDYGFLTTWFLTLTYLAILWANATSIPLFARYFLGNTFQFGRIYSLFGYDVYLGEALLSIAALLLVAGPCAIRKALMAVAMTLLSLVFCGAIVVCFVCAISG